MTSFEFEAGHLSTTAMSLYMSMMGALDQHHLTGMPSLLMK
eukprot:CAMPEP_0184489954 /NCGR_PEP_ID=MMETSP0113_2-20130426/16748_1 /TAXON_ID=91329 /ORGANISM="Norrisiella sphaerica, Strain BC52" /LENGTH=40 /DNA_ID= /DNA_START= /DNA_END= /DNA_ORIENTATION=